MLLAFHVITSMIDLSLLCIPIMIWLLHTNRDKKKCFLADAKPQRFEFHNRNKIPKGCRCFFLAVLRYDINQRLLINWIIITCQMFTWMIFANERLYESHVIYSMLTKTVRRLDLDLLRRNAAIPAEGI